MCQVHCYHENLFLILHILIDATTNDDNRVEHDVFYVGYWSEHMSYPSHLSLLRHIPHHKNISIPHVCHWWCDATSHNHVV